MYTPHKALISASQYWKQAHLIMRVCDSEVHGRLSKYGLKNLSVTKSVYMRFVNQNCNIRNDNANSQSDAL